MSTARCYLDPIRNRQNLHIETGALTQGLVLDGKRCTGVRYSVGGETREAVVAREVVVSAGIGMESHWRTATDGALREFLAGLRRRPDIFLADQNQQRSG